MQLKQNEVNRVGPNAMWLVSFIRRGDQDTDRHRGKAMWKHGENVATYVPRTEASGRGRALWESHWGCRPAGQPPVTLKHNTSSWVQSSLKAHSKVVQVHSEVQGRMSCLPRELPQTLAILAEASQSRLTLLCPSMVSVRASVATERVQASQSLCATLLSDTILAEGGWTVLVFPSLSWQFQRARTASLPSHPLHGSYLEANLCRRRQLSETKITGTSLVVQWLRLCKDPTCRN